MKWKKYIRTLMLKSYLFNRFVLYVRRVAFFSSYLKMKRNAKKEIWEIKELSEELKNSSTEWCLDASNFEIAMTGRTRRRTGRRTGALRIRSSRRSRPPRRSRNSV